MRWLLLVVAVSSWGGLARAGEAHGRISCSECHVRSPKGGAPGPEVATEICFACHGGAGPATSVVGELAGGDPGAPSAAGLERSAGLFQLGHGAAGGHVIGSDAPPPGFDGVWPGGHRLTCRSCHAIHGNDNYRNLAADPEITDSRYLAATAALFGSGRALSYAVVPDAWAARTWQGADVFVTASARKDSRSYGLASVAFATNDGRNAMNAFCASCHTRFHGWANTQPQGAGEYVRHPTSGVPLEGRTKEAFDRARYPPRVNWRPDGKAEVGCLTCHRAHGSGREYGLVFWDPRSPQNGVAGAAADVTSLCRTCHALDDR